MSKLLVNFRFFTTNFPNKIKKEKKKAKDGKITSFLKNSSNQETTFNTFSVDDILIFIESRMNVDFNKIKINQTKDENFDLNAIDNEFLNHNPTYKNFNLDAVNEFDCRNDKNLEKSFIFYNMLINAQSNNICIKQFETFTDKLSVRLDTIKKPIVLTQK